MASRIYDITLSCGCMLSLDGGGAAITCGADYLGYTDDGKVRELTEDEKKQVEKCKKSWEEYRASNKYKEHQKEIARRNGDLDEPLVCEPYCAPECTCGSSGCPHCGQFG